jgi:ferredoxin
MFAARNIELCTKDCACLFVCPTGATDTEDGTIDAEKCIDGCRLCVDACPSGAIHLVYQRIPKQSLPQEELTKVLSRLLVNKADLFVQSGVVAEGTKSKNAAGFYAALALSNQILGEDCIRESGHLVPEAERMEDLVRSGLIQRLYQQNHRDSEALDQILNTILESLREHRDAEARSSFLCQECGQVMFGEKPTTCPGCTSDRIKAF